MQKVSVKIIDIKFVKNNLSEISSAVGKERLERSERYLNENDRLLSLGAGFLLKKYLPENEFDFNKNGKPYLKDGPFFNLSHSGEYAVLVIDNSREVGVDIEHINEEKLPVIERVLKEKLSVGEAFLAWSNKESLIKCAGLNIALIKDAPYLPLSGARRLKNDYYYTSSTVYNGYSLSVTLKGKDPFEIAVESAFNA